MMVYDFEGFPNPARSQTLGYFDEVLSEDDWVSGKEFSMADITLFAGLAFADFAGIEVPAECVDLNAWRQRMASTSSIAN